jgi:hypothetical protein
MIVRKYGEQLKTFGVASVAVASVVFFLFFAISAQATTTRVSLWGAPSAVLPFLRELQPNIDWQLESDGSEAQLHITWQPDAYKRLQMTGKREPALLLTSSLNDQQLIRSQDSALVWGPPLSQQVRLALRVMPGAKRIGVIARRLPDPEAMQMQMRNMDVVAASVRSEGVTLVPLVMSAPISARALAEASEQVDIFVATNDDALFNRETAKLILLTAYRHKRALIGPSPAFVSAGAVATMAVSKSALLAELLARIERWQKNGRLGAPEIVGNFQPVLNPQVARSLGLYLSPDLLREARP